MDHFLTPNGQTDRAGYVRYLRGAAQRWRAAPIWGTETQRAEQRHENEAQAARVEAKADRIERGGNE